MSVVAEKIAAYYEDPARLSDLTEKQGLFLRALKGSGIVLRACERADISRQLAYTWRTIYPEFRRLWDEALEDAVDTVEESLYDQAVSRKNVVATIFYLKNNRHKYRDRVTIDIGSTHRELEEQLDAVREKVVSSAGGKGEDRHLSSGPLSLPPVSAKDIIADALGLSRRNPQSSQLVTVETSDHAPGDSESTD